MTLRLYLPGLRAGDTEVRIAGPELRHLRTLRLGPGTHLHALDDSGGEHDVVLERLDGHAAVGRVVASARPARESPLDLVLAPALLKGSKLDRVVEKATELGVQRLAPVVTRHVVGRGAHRERWQRIAVAATKQSGRTRVPTIDEPVPLATLVGAPWPGVRLVPWEGEPARRFDELTARADAAIALVGPEGGFAPEELALAVDRGFTPITLGPRILRAETASLVVVARCQARWGDG